jgi:hypothetical protein
MLGGRAPPPRSGTRGERSAAVEVLAQLSTALRGPALALLQARDQVQRPGQALLAVAVAK